MTIQRGIDPREFALLSFGGSGPAQSPAVMDLIGMKACIVPPNPGNLSAFGLLAVDWRTDHIVTKVMHEDAIDLAAVADIYAGLESRRRRDPGARRHRAFTHPARARGRRALCRAVHGSARAGALGRGRPRVHRRSGRCVPRRASQDLRLQLRRPAEGGAGQFLRVRFRHDRPPEHSQARHRPGRGAEAAAAGRSISTAPSARRRSTSARSLAAGFRLDGPAVVEEFGSTTVVFPGQHLEVDAHGILIVRPARRALEAVR